MNKPIIFIGGPSQSGKSTLSAKLAAQHGIVWHNLDHDPWIKRLMKHFRWRIVFRLMQLRCIFIVFSAKGPCIIDCPYLAPDIIARRAQRKDDFLPIFLGYPDANIAQRVEQLVSLDFKDAGHLSKLDDHGRKRALSYYRGVSRRHQKRCAELDIPYFAFADLDQLTQAQDQATSWIGARLAVEET